MKIKVTLEIELNETAVEDRLNNGESPADLQRDVIHHMNIRHQLIEDYTVIDSEVK